jgi:hypothetical protein
MVSVGISLMNVFLDCVGIVHHYRVTYGQVVRLILKLISWSLFLAHLEVQEFQNLGASALRTVLIVVKIRTAHQVAILIKNFQTMLVI